MANMTGNKELPFWLDPSWSQVQQMLTDDRLPHGLVISGLPGLGKRQLADTLAASLLCHTPVMPQQMACGQCKSCLLRQSGSHPDLKHLQPEAEGKAILVDMVRQIQPWLAATSQQGGAKVVLIEPANELNANAANALLKNLEEPGQNTYFILLHHWPKPLLPTIRSRCQVHTVLAPAAEQVQPWLAQQAPDAKAEKLIQVQQMAHGAPLLAVDYLRHDAPAQRHQTLVDLTAILRNQISVSEVAESWAKDPLPQRLDWWLQWQQDLIKLQQTQDSQQVVNQDVIKLLQAIARKAEIKAVFGLYDDTLQALDSLSQRRNINQQLLLEKLLYSWYQLI